MKAVKAKCKTWKRKQTNTLLIQFQLFIFRKPTCLQKFFHGRALSIRGIFLGRALSVDGVSPRMNTIASRDQFKPIRIGENLVVNYNCRLANLACQLWQRVSTPRIMFTRLSVSWQGSCLHLHKTNVRKNQPITQWCRKCCFLAICTICV